MIGDVNSYLSLAHTSNAEMNPKKQFRLITYITVAIVAAILVVAAVLIYYYNSGQIDYNMFIMSCAVLSPAMFLVVILYAVIAMKTDDTAAKYEEYVRRLEEEKKQ